MTRAKSTPRRKSARRSSTGDKVALVIRRMIFDGELRPGTRVPQDEVTSKLGVSRIPVREALIALEREGWVTIEPFRGAFVNALDESSVRDNYELLGRVWGFAAKRAIARSGEELATRLTDLKSAAEHTDDPGEFGAIATAFQGAVVEAAHSSNINVVLRAIGALVPGEFFEFLPEAMPIQRRAFAAIAKAIRLGDGDAAEAEFVRAMRRIGRLVVVLFRERGLFEAADNAA